MDVGRVEAIQLSPGDRAQVTLRLEPGLKLHDDAIASIRTKGIIGDKFVKLSPGSSEKAHSAGRQDPGHRVGHRSGGTDQQLHPRQSLSPD